MNKTYTIIFSFLFFFLLFWQQKGWTQNTWYVNTNLSTGVDNGTSPANAFKNLHNALNNPALAFDDTIKVATGIYVPSQTISGGTANGNRDNSFLITKNIILMGGYSVDFSKHNPEIFPTILDGDRGTPGSSADNCHHVVAWNTSGAGHGLLAGFTIRNGNANGTSSINGFARNSGGGIYHNGGSLTLSNVIIENNSATSTGAGIYGAALLTIRFCTIRNNISSSTGGGIYSTTEPLTLENSTISSNKATQGGGVHANNGLVLKGKIFFRNDTATSGSANTGGGAIFKNGLGSIDGTTLDSLFIENCQSGYLGGGIYSTLPIDLPKLNYVRISNNTAKNNGGGIYAASTLILIGNEIILNGNTATGNGGGIYASGNASLSGKVKLNNNIAAATSSNGGGIYANASLALSNELILDNNIAASGGGIWKSTSAGTSFDLTQLDSLIITNCQAKNGSGGGIYAGVALDMLNLKRVELSNNTASQHGGGIYANNSLFVKNVFCSDNKAGYLNGVFSGSYNGGAIYAGNSLTLAGKLVFNHNEANNNGGAIFKSTTGNADANELETLIVIGCNSLVGTGGGMYAGVALEMPNLMHANISNNKAGQGGGGIYANNILSIKNAIIANNKAGWNFTTNDYSTTLYHGGGIYAANALTLAGKLTFDTDIATGSGGGLWKSATGSLGATELDTLILKRNEARSTAANNGGGGVFAGVAFDMSNLKYAIIDNNKAIVQGGGIYANNSLTIAGEVTVTNNIAGLHGGGIYKVATGALNTNRVNSLVLENNRAETGSGGGIYTAAILDLSNAHGRIVGNTAALTGGGIHTSANLLIGNFSISGNKSGWDGFSVTGTTNHGGGIYISAVITMAGKMNFENNEAGGSGGAIYSSSTTIFDVAGTDTLIAKNNRAAVSGGTLYASADLSFLSLKQGIFSGNTANLNGGAICFASANTFFLQNSSFKQNEASSGGAIYNTGKIDIKKSSFYNNTASTDGGAIYKGTFNELIVQQTTFSQNTANRGGAIFSEFSGAAQKLTNNTFSQNTSIGSGAAIYFSHANGAAATISFSSFNGNTASNDVGNALYYVKPTGTLFGNIIYNNGVNSEVNNVSGLAAQYNIIRNTALTGTDNQNVPDGQIGDIFEPVSGNNAILNDNGGTTKTLLIKKGGKAYDKIPQNISMTYTAIDQRDENRIVDFADIGAVELAPEPCIGYETFRVWYVDASGGTGNNDGTSFADRTDDLAKVLDNTCLKDGDTVKLAQGTYFSTQTDPLQSFFVTKSIVIKGGYPSGNFSEINRNTTFYPTILDGYKKSYHVIVWNTGDVYTGIIDGVTIQNGWAIGNTASLPQDNGGGVLLNSGKLLISNAKIQSNIAKNNGGGIYSSVGAYLKLKNIESYNNKAGYNGSVYNKTLVVGGANPDVSLLETRAGGSVCAIGNLELQGVLSFVADTSAINGGAIFKSAFGNFTATALDTLVMTDCNAKGAMGASNSINGEHGGGGIYTMVDLNLEAARLFFTNCKTDNNQGGGIFINNKTGRLVYLRVANGIFIKCYAGTDGGALESFSSTKSVVYVKNSQFKDCDVGRYGGALGIGNSLILEGKITIDGCDAGTNGGGISQWNITTTIPNSFDVTLLDTLIITNCSTQGKSFSSNFGDPNAMGGGGIWIQQSPLDCSTIKYLHIENCYSGEHGGGIKLKNSYDLILNNVFFKNNKAGYSGTGYSGAFNGGGVYTAGVLTLKGTAMFLENSASQHGGAIYGTSTITANTIETLTFTGNEAKGIPATGHGGAIYSGNKLSLTNSSIYANSAKDFGGGLYVSTSDLTINNSTIAGNTALNGGGAYMANGILTLENATFSKNKATLASGNTGGAVYSAGTGKAAAIYYSTFNGNTPTAIYFPEATNKSFKGNILYGNGSGAEINVLPAVNAYNLVKDAVFSTTNGNIIVAANRANEIFRDIESGDFAALADNGGKTKTLMLLSEGLAQGVIPIEIAKNIDVNLKTDQRGRPRYVGCGSDCGSVELQSNESKEGYYELASPTICPGVLVSFDTLITIAENIDDTIFYKDKNYTQELPSSVTSLRTVYVKFHTIIGCYLYDSIKLVSPPVPTVRIAGSKNIATCAGSSLTLTATTTNTTSILWYNYQNVATGTGQNTNTLRLVFNQRSTDTVVWVYVGVQSTGTCDPVKDSVRVTIRKTPSVKIITNDGLDKYCYNNVIPLAATLLETSPNWIGWYDSKGALVEGSKSQYIPDAVGYTQVNYVPHESEQGKTIKLFVRVNTASCGYIADTIHLRILPLPTDMAFELLSQPIGLQEMCADTVYELKLKSSSQGDLKNVKVIFNDNQTSNIEVLNAEYEKPFNSGNWIDIGQGTDLGTNVSWDVLETLQAGDSIKMKIIVKAPCNNFQSGFPMKLMMDAKTICGNDISQKVLLTGNYNIRQTIGNLNKYNVLSALNDTLLLKAYDSISVNNSLSDTIVWRLAAIKQTAFPNDLTREFIQASLPQGLTPIFGSYRGIKNAPAYTSLQISYTPEGDVIFKIPMDKQIAQNDTIIAQFKFTTTQAGCNLYDEDFWARVAFVDTADCNGTLCPFDATLGKVSPKLNVDKYRFSLVNDSIYGRVVEQLWYGSINVKAENRFYAGDSCYIDFYIDNNNNNVLDPGDELAKKFIHIIGNINPGGTFMIDFDSVRIELQKQLLAKVYGSSFCPLPAIPVATLNGIDVICQNDTVLFYSVPGKQNYKYFLTDVDAISGATIGGKAERIPLEGSTVANYPNESVLRIYFKKGGNFNVSGKYTISAINHTVNPAYFPIHVNRMPELTFPGGRNISICAGNTVSIAVDTVAATSILWSGFTNVAGTATGETSKTLVYKSFPRTTDTTFYIRVAVYGEAPCKPVIDSVKMTIFGKPEFAFVSDTVACGSINLKNLPVVSGSILNLSFDYWNSDYSVKLNTMADSITESGTYHIVGKSTASCSDTSTVNVAINQLPKVIIYGEDSICSGDETALIIESSGGTGPWTVNIDNGIGTIIIPESGRVTIQIQPLVTTTYYITRVKNKEGCETTYDH